MQKLHNLNDQIIILAFLQINPVGIVVFNIDVSSNFDQNRLGHIVFFRVEYLVTLYERCFQLSTEQM